MMIGQLHSTVLPDVSISLKYYFAQFYNVWLSKYQNEQVWLVILSSLLQELFPCHALYWLLYFSQEIVSVM